MTNYVKIKDFAAADALPTGTAAKAVKGTDFGLEFPTLDKQPGGPGGHKGTAEIEGE